MLSFVFAYFTEFQAEKKFQAYLSARFIWRSKRKIQHTSIWFRCLILKSGLWFVRKSTSSHLVRFAFIEFSGDCGFDRVDLGKHFQMVFRFPQSASIQPLPSVFWRWCGFHATPHTPRRSASKFLKNRAARGFKVGGAESIYLLNLFSSSLFFTLSFFLRFLFFYSSPRSTYGFFFEYILYWSAVRSNWARSGWQPSILHSFLTYLESGPPPLI